MLPGAASVITQAMAGPWAANASTRAGTSLNGRTTVSAAVAPVTPGLSGSANVASPLPA